MALKLAVCFPHSSPILSVAIDQSPVLFTQHRQAISFGFHEAGANGVQRAEKATQKVKEVAGMSSSEAKGKAEELKGEAKGKASELAGEAKGKANEIKGKMWRVSCAEYTEAGLKLMITVWLGRMTEGMKIYIYIYI